MDARLGFKVFDFLTEDGLVTLKSQELSVEGGLDLFELLLGLGELGLEGDLLVGKLGVAVVEILSDLFLLGL